MGRDFRRATVQQPRRQIHPIWRGIGCISVVGLIAGGFYFSGWFLAANTANGWINIPQTFNGPPQFPWFYARLAITILVAVMGFAVLTFIYGLVSPVRPGELDAPPVRSARRRR